MGEKYPILKPSTVINALEKIGFHFASQKGSHRKYSNGISVCIVPMHNVIARGTLRAILLQANISLNEFLEKL